MKKIVALILLAVMLVFTGCSSEPEEPDVLETINVPDGKVTDQELELELAFGRNKGIYTGDIKNNVPHGEGIFVFEHEMGGWTYTGQWEAGHMNGTGKREWTSGYKYEGEYKNDLMHGEGKYYSRLHLVYEGQWKDNKMSGQGKKYDEKTGKLAYEGEFANNNYNGEGKLYNNDEVVYEGKFVSGQPETEEVTANSDEPATQATNADGETVGEPAE